MRSTPKDKVDHYKRNHQDTGPDGQQIDPSPRFAFLYLQFHSRSGCSQNLEVALRNLLRPFGEPVTCSQIPAAGLQQAGILRRSYVTLHMN
jgi:hypothetical protein